MRNLYAKNFIRKLKYFPPFFTSVKKTIIIMLRKMKHKNLYLKEDSLVKTMKKGECQNKKKVPKKDTAITYDLNGQNIMNGTCICMICAERKRCTFINCHEKRVQYRKVGKKKSSFEPICSGCRLRCKDKCPRCCSHILKIQTVRFSKKKQSYKERLPLVTKRLERKRKRRISALRRYERQLYNKLCGPYWMRHS